MRHYRLNRFLNNHDLLQRFILMIIASLFTIYIVSYSLDLYGLMSTLAHNNAQTEIDTSLIEVLDYSLNNGDATINGEEFKDINIVQYGLSEDTKVYFSREDNTLIQRIPSNFGVSFILSTNAMVALTALVAMTFMFYYLNNDDEKEKLHAINIGVCRLFVVLSIVLLTILLFTLMILS